MTSRDFTCVNAGKVAARKGAFLSPDQTIAPSAIGKQIFDVCLKRTDDLQIYALGVY